MPEFSPQNISNFLWAFAKLGVQHHDLFVEGGPGWRRCAGSAGTHFLAMMRVPHLEMQMLQPL